MNLQPILLVEDNDDDADLTVMAFREANIANPIIRVKDGVDAKRACKARVRTKSLRPAASGCIGRSPTCRRPRCKRAN